jgi:hypothetical protein
MYTEIKIEKVFFKVTKTDFVSFAEHLTSVLGEQFMTEVASKTKAYQDTRYGCTYSLVGTAMADELDRIAKEAEQNARYYDDPNDLDMWYKEQIVICHMVPKSHLAINKFDCTLVKRAGENSLTINFWIDCAGDWVTETPTDKAFSDLQEKEAIHAFSKAFRDKKKLWWLYNGEKRG